MCQLVELYDFVTVWQSQASCFQSQLTIYCTMRVVLSQQVYVL